MRTNNDILLISEYLDNCILERYKLLDPSHSVQHIKDVWRRGKYISSLIDEVDLIIVKVICYFHDIGMEIQRENHSYYSGEILKKDEFLIKFFTDEEIVLMKDAVEEHSSTIDVIPNSIYGKIVKDADKDDNVDEALSRAYFYSKNNHIGENQNEWIEATFQHLNLKFGTNGLVKYYILPEDKNSFYKTMKELAFDRKKFDEKINIIIKERN